MSSRCSARTRTARAATRPHRCVAGAASDHCNESCRERIREAEHELRFNPAFRLVGSPKEYPPTLELHPEFHAARVEFARALQALGETAQALEVLDQVVEAEPGHVEALELRQRWGSPRRGRSKGEITAHKPS